MALIFYLPGERNQGNFCRKVLETVTPKREIEIYHSIHKLKLRLQKPVPDVKLAVLSIPTNEEFMKMISMADFLWDVKTILMLPDDSPDTLAMARMLCPRFSTWVNKDSGEFETVLKKDDNVLIINIPKDNKLLNK